MGNVSVTTKVKDKDAETSHYPDVSDETCDKIKALIEADKPKFEPIDIDCVTVGVDTKNDIYIRITKNMRSTCYPISENDIGCWYKPYEIGEFIQALQEAKAFVEANK